MGEIRSMFDPEAVFFFYAGVMIILAIGFGLFIHICKDINLKRKAFKVSVYSAGILFVIFMFFWPIPGQWFFFITPVVVLIIVLNLKLTRFCNECGKMVVNENPFSKPKFCSKCGVAFHS